MKNISIAYVAPGWPLNRYPNGIVSYIENLLSGFGGDVDPYVFSNKVAIETIDKTIVDLTQFNRNLYKSLSDKVFYRLKMLQSEGILYQRNLVNTAEYIAKGINSLPFELDLIELEESFGVATKLSNMTCTPIVTRLHGPWFIIGDLSGIRSENHQIRVRKEGLGINASHGVSSPSQDVLDKVREYYDFSLPNAKVIPNPIASVPVDMRWRIELSAKPSILFIGRFDSIKGADIAINAFRIVALQNKEVELIFAGPDRGMIINGEEYHLMEYLDKFIPEISVKNRIKFLGHCTAQHVAELRKASSVTMITSRYENFPMSLLEALAAGCPVVGVATGGIKEIITDEYNGLLAEPELPESIAENLIALLSDPNKMEKVSKNAIVDSQKRFSPETVAKQTLDFYKSVIAN